MTQYSEQIIFNDKSAVIKNLQWEWKKTASTTESKNTLFKTVKCNKAIKSLRKKHTLLLQRRNHCTTHYYKQLIRLIHVLFMLMTKLTLINSQRQKTCLKRLWWLLRSLKLESSTSFKINTMSEDKKDTLLTMITTSSSQDEDDFVKVKDSDEFEEFLKTEDQWLFTHKEK